MPSEVFFDNLLSKALKNEKAAFITLYNRGGYNTVNGWGFDLRAT
jgi:hypothetical protein